MKRLLFALLALSLSTAFAAVPRGDLNHDNAVDVTDISTMIDIMLGKYQPPAPEPKTGYDYVWDLDVIPEIHLEVSLSEWNRLLDLYDANSKTKQYVHASARYVHDGEVTEIDDIGIRLKGNTSRRRPEGEWGTHHITDNTDWRHVHFGVNFRKYVKDDDHTVQGIRKLHLKWFKDDPAYVREVYCYDLFRRFGVWTGARDNYCRVWLHIEGDTHEAYYGVYEMLEPVDQRFIKNREDLFGGTKGNLWKCTYATQPANLRTTDSDFWYDDDTDDDHSYSLETDNNEFEDAKTQMFDFINKLNNKQGEDFYNWITGVCDVDLLLKTYAVNVAVGMWDDYWNNGNNYYLYFNNNALEGYKVFFIPYDYDNSLGTTLREGNQSDAGRQDPLHWGRDENPLITKILQFDDLKAIYVKYLNQLGADDSPFAFKNSRERILAWHARIADFVANDTGEDMVIEDKPASWGNHSEYRLLPNNNNNYFRVKAQVLRDVK